MMSNRRIAKTTSKTDMVITTEDEQDADGDDNGQEDAQEEESPDALGEAANLVVKDQTDDAAEPDDAEK